MTQKARVLLALALSTASFHSHAVTLNPENGHYYLLVDFTDDWRLDWNDAKSHAETLTHNGVSGHLATITNQQEDDFIWQLGGEGRFLGGFNNSTLNEAGEWVHNDWQWVTGEAFSFYNWVEGEPNHWNDGTGQTPANEDYLMYWWSVANLIGRWNDTNVDSSWFDGNSIVFTTQGFIVEFSTSNTSPVPLPGAFWLFSSGLLLAAGYLRRSHTTSFDRKTV